MKLRVVSGSCKSYQCDGCQCCEMTLPNSSKCFNINLIQTKINSCGWERNEMPESLGIMVKVILGISGAQSIPTVHLGCNPNSYIFLRDTPIQCYKHEHKPRM